MDWRRQTGFVPGIRRLRFRQHADRLGFLCKISGAAVENWPGWECGRFMLKKSLRSNAGTSSAPPTPCCAHTRLWPAFSAVNSASRAQTTTGAGRIVGTVTDPAGRVVSRAQVSGTDSHPFLLVDVCSYRSH
jgi:hypothetical protein